MNIRTLSLAIIFTTSLTLVANADLVLTGAGIAVTEDFTGFTGNGFDPGGTMGRLDSNTWATTGWSNGTSDFGDTNTTGDFARGQSDGGVGTGGIYSFDPNNAGDVGLGFQPGGSDFTPGSITMRVLNSTGEDLASFDLSYDVGAFNDQDRSNSLNLSFSTDGTNFTNVDGFDFSSPGAQDPFPSWVIDQRSGNIQFTTPLADGQQFFLRWNGDDVSGGGARDEFILDDISVTGIAATVPEPSSLATIGILGLIGAYRMRRKKNQKSEE